MMMMTMTTTTTTATIMMMIMRSFYLKTAKLSPLLTILNLKVLLDYKWHK